MSSCNSIRSTSIIYQTRPTRDNDIMVSTHAFSNGEKAPHAQVQDHYDTTTSDVTYDKESSEITSNLDEKTTEDATTEADYPSGLKLALIILALALSIFLMALDLTIIATAIPKITSEFHGLKDVSWYSAAFFMTIGGFQSAWGKAYKYFNLKITFLVSIFIFELGSLICGVAPNSTTLIVGRAIAGLGAGGIGSGCYTIIAFSAGPKNRPMFTGIIGCSYGVAAVVGPLMGGAFADKVTWRWCFYINLPIGAISALIILVFFQTPRAAIPKEATLTEKLLQMDPVGAVLVMGAVISYILALHYGGLEHAWNSSVVIGLFVGFLLLSATFVVWEWCQEDRAMMPFRIASQRVYWVNSAFAFFFSGAYFLMIFFLPVYFQSVDNVSAAMSGVRNLPLIVAVTISMLGSGAYISITGIAAPITVAGTAIGLICMGLLYTLDVDSSNAKWIGYQVIGGVGWGIASQVPIITVQATASAADLPEATAILLFFQTVGGAFMVSAAQSAFVNVMIKTLPTSAPGINPLLVVATGATDLRKAFTPEQLPGILAAYMKGLQTSFAIGIASTGVALIVIMFQRWNKLNTAAIAGGPVA
jgi:MFS family permease